MVIRRVRPEHPDAVSLIAALDAELRDRYPEASVIHGLHAHDTASARLIFVVAYLDNVPVACGAVRELDAATGEIKRMFVLRERRGRGVARAVLAALESAALEAGYGTLRIETGTKQEEAAALYRSSGYCDIPCFGEYSGNAYSVCFEKKLAHRSDRTHLRQT